MASHSQQARKQPVYAVVRMDHFAHGGVDISHRITIKEILPTAEEADAEVERLQALKPRDEVEYFVAGGNWFPDGRRVRADY